MAGKKSAAKKKASPAATWLTPFYDDWQTRFGGKPPAGVMAKTLKPLVDEHGAAAVREAWRAWLTEQNAAYVSVPRFGMTYGSWAGHKPRALGKGDQSMLAAARWAATANRSREDE